MICAIVLAAGSSCRMGFQKLLLPFGGKTVITHIVDQLLASSIDEVYVVVGNQAERIRRELSDRPVSIVTNVGYKSGMLSSVRCGLHKLPPQCETVLVALGDQPSITSELVDRMLRSFTTSEKSILVPLFKGRRGHPILFSITHRDDIMTHYEDIGLRGLLHIRSNDVYELDVSTSSVLLDMDYPEDYRRELMSFDQTNKPKT